MTNKDKFMSPFYWKKVHQLITSATSKNNSKYRIYQVKKIMLYVNMLIITHQLEGKKHTLKNHVSVILDQFMDQPV